MPDFSPGWPGREDLEPFRYRSRALLSRLAEREPLGWKDPRNSLTLPFWQRIVPELQVVVCVRHPLEAASSIRKAVVRSGVDAPVRGLEYGLELWRQYQERIRGAVEPGRYIVTHYESWFRDPRAEIERIATWVGLRPGSEELERAVEGIDPALRRNVAGNGDADTRLPPEVRRLYDLMCSEAGPLFAGASGR